MISGFRIWKCFLRIDSRDNLDMVKVCPEWSTSTAIIRICQIWTLWFQNCVEQVRCLLSIEKPSCLLFLALLYFSPTSAESLKALERKQVEKTHGCAWRKENVYPDLLAPHVKIIFRVYDLMDTKDISNGYITTDWHCEFCRTLATSSWIFLGPLFDQKGLFESPFFSPSPHPTLPQQVTGRGDLEDS